MKDPYIYITVSLIFGLIRLGNVLHKEEGGWKIFILCVTLLIYSWPAYILWSYYGK